MNVKKYLIGFAMFALYYIVMRNLENKIAPVQKLTNVGK
jgi:hypothetical protein